MCTLCIGIFLTVTGTGTETLFLILVISDKTTSQNSATTILDVLHRLLVTFQTKTHFKQQVLMRY